MDSNPKLMTLAEAAKQSACSPKTIRRAVNAGELAACRLGESARSDRIHPADLATWWEKSKVQPPPDVAWPIPRKARFELESAEDRIARRIGPGRGQAKGKTGRSRS